MAAVLLDAAVLSDDERDIVRRLSQRLGNKRSRHAELTRCYQGIQSVKTLGLAIPEDLRGFEFALNWCRVVVDSIEQRQDVRALLRPGDQTDDTALREGWDANNMESQAPLNHRETLVHGQGFVTVSTNEDDAEHPIITVESARAMAVDIDHRKRRMKACLRLWTPPHRSTATRGTLYLPDSTVWLERGRRGWQVTDRDDHRLGRVPVVMFLNRRAAGSFDGETEMADVIPIVAMATRTIANLQFAAEILAMPKYILWGAKKADFVGMDGSQKTNQLEAYLDSIWAMADPDGKAQRLDGGNLANFIQVVAMLAQQVSAVTGLPMRYFGPNTANPAAEGAIRADEARLVKNVERKNREAGDAWGWVMALYERFRTGSDIDGNRVRVQWFDPGTPTFAQKADAVQKLTGGMPILSREGAWDELQWPEERKTREREAFAAQESDPYLSLLEAKGAAATAPADR